MPQTFLIFDFGDKEDAAQQARHRLEGWKQALRLGDRLQFKFERPAAESPADAPSTAETAKKAKRGKGEPAATKELPTGSLRLIVQLEFSDHEKLSYQRWLNRIPMESPFPEATKRLVHRGQADFDQTVKLFSELP